MSRADRFDFTLDEETEKRLFDLLTDMDTRSTNRFCIKDKRGYNAEYVKIIRCKDCKFLRLTGTVWKCQNRLVMMLCEPNDYCSRAERREE